MTDKEALRWFEHRREMHLGDKCENAERVAISALRERINRNDGWISVDDRLPEPFFDVLVFYIHKYYPNSGYFKIDVMSRSCVTNNCDSYWTTLSDNYIVTHWMPLPNPPRNDNK